MMSYSAFNRNELSHLFQFTVMFYRDLVLVFIRAE